ncbi:hypothetical protein K432DRAFT_407030 [Lepidopterella palustris CBS 459.81]|uniref:DUF6594 domain-containing protein n=1 Tax=Lepidopterella palustris CBS 459.81 TaxID=1314670 RepID=A0A8E2JD88_9PEZI|nr:hypothetical protein K432DRAFT_407030 [Lepidopterella palustris CBS 459.81]
MATPTLAGEPVRGYPSLSKLMGSISETAIFQKFSTLTARDLLYRQAELKHLLQRLEDMERKDSQSGKEEDRSWFARDWYQLSIEIDEKGNHSEQWNLFKEIREKLWSYREALIQAATIEGYPEPKNFDLNVIQHHLDQIHEGGGLTLLGLDSQIWGSTNGMVVPALDLMVLRRRDNLSGDSFTSWFTGILLPFFDKIYGYRFNKIDPRYGLPGYMAGPLLETTFKICTVIASLLPIASITVLFCVNSMAWRLVTMAILSIVFASCLSVFANPRRSELFTATSAFASVLVVFIGSNNINNNIGR